MATTSSALANSLAAVGSVVAFFTLVFTHLYGAEPQKEGATALPRYFFTVGEEYVYTEKDVFLRELISNASGACDKLRYNAIADPDLLAGDTRLAIRIEADKTAGTLTVQMCDLNCDCK